ncbi:Ktr system potassium uptake protein A, partial [Dysosmobacter welbionis]
FSTEFSTGRGRSSHDPKIADQIRGHVHDSGDRGTGRGIHGCVFLRQAEHRGHQPSGAPAGHGGRHSQRPAGSGAQPGRGRRSAALFHGESLGPQRNLRGLCHRRDLFQSAGHTGAADHSYRLSPAEPARGHYPQLRPAVSAPGLWTIRAHRLCGHVHGAGHIAGDHGLLSANRSGGAAAASGRLHPAGPVGHPPGGKGLAAAAAVPFRRLSRAEDAA